MFGSKVNRIVKRLRKLSEKLAEVDGRVIFPEPGGHDDRAVKRALYVLNTMGEGGTLYNYQVAVALYYIADMLEE